MSVTPTGRAHCQRRLSAATSLSDLEEVHARLGDHYKADDEVKSHYLRCKRGLS